ncbi:hypothetical protein [Streptomyces sp. NPDC051561]|uniref:hypothetical protein n=1 Tax=Streptomyces sp. NPDC051561 TaxID=3365658 RepID=UPI0037A7AD73
MAESYHYSAPLTAEDAERMGQLLGLVIATSATACATKTGFSVDFFMARFTMDSTLDAVQLEFLSRIARGESEVEAAAGAGGFLIDSAHRAMRRAVLIAQLQGR